MIENPPWVSLKGKFGVRIYPKVEIDYLIQKFKGNTYMPNMYEYFVSQGLSLIATKGFFSFIVPDRLGFNSQFTHLRKRILNETQIVSLVYKVPFPGITADTLIFVFKKEPTDSRREFMEICEYGNPPIETPQKQFLENSNFAFQYFENTDVMGTIKKMETLPHLVRLQAICKSTSGFGGKSQLITEIQTGCITHFLQVRCA